MRSLINLCAILGAMTTPGIAGAACPGLYIYDVMNRPPYRLAYEQMLRGERGLPSWMASATSAAHATGEPAFKRKIGNDDREVFKICEPHNCGGHLLIVTFTEFEGPAYGLLAIDGKLRFLGHPDAAQRKALSAMDDSAR